MSDMNSFFPTVGSLVPGDKIIVTKALNLTGINGIPIGATATINSALPHGDLAILSVEIDGEFAASVIASDTEVELKTPF
jgi:hypothetical protein